MIKGIDISHWNRDRINEDTLVEYAHMGFVFLKSSEGIGYTDPMFSTYAGDWLDLDNPHLGNALSYCVGFYHYCHPETGNDARREMTYFWRTVRPYLHFGAVLALDIEGEALKMGASALNQWTEEAAEAIRDLSGKPPVIYCGKSTLPYIRNAAAHDCGLWLAKWSNESPVKEEIRPWPFWALWQSGMKYGLDVDWFNGTQDQFRQYAVKLPRD